MIKRLLTTALTLITLGLSAQEFVDITPEAYVDIDFLCVDFIDDSTGFIGADDNYLYRTDDGGNTWTYKKMPFLPIQIHFFDKDTGVIVGFSSIYRTIDGGDSWYYVDTLADRPSTFRDQFQKFEVVDDTTCYALGYPGLIWKSDDKGETWTEQYRLFYDFTKDFIYTLHYYSEDSAVASARQGFYYTTTNGGNSWQYDTDQGKFPQNIYTHYFITKDTGFAGTTTGDIMKSTNGGRSWQFYASGVDMDFMKKIEFINEDTGYIIGAENFYYTYNRGIDWNNVNIGANKDIENACIINDSTIIAVGYNTQISKSTDYGKTWETNYYGAPSGFGDICFINKDTGFVNLFMERIMKTEDGGNSWRKIRVTNENLMLKGEFSFPNDTLGFIGMGGGASATAYNYLFRTEDGGETWEKIYTIDKVPSDKFLLFPSSDTGYAGSDFFGTLMQSVDAGKTWHSYTCTFDMKIEGNQISAFFYNSQYGCVVSTGGEISKTTDGGISWEEIDIPTNVSITSLYLPNFDEIYAFTWRGSVFYSGNAGQSWDSITNLGNKLKKIIVRDKRSFFYLTSDLSDSIFISTGDLKSYLKVKKDTNWESVEFVNPFLAYYITKDDKILKVNYPHYIVLDSFPDTTIVISEEIQTYLFEIKENYFFDSTNVFYILLSDENGSFENPDTIAYLTSDTGGVVNVSFGDIESSDNYMIKIVSTSPKIESNAYGPISISNISAVNNLLEELKCIIYPNPVKNKAYISQEAGINSITIININGKAIKSFSGNNISEIDVSDLSPGVYILKLESIDEMYYERILVE